jgi:hypothetical protein
VLKMLQDPSVKTRHNIMIVLLMVISTLFFCRLSSFG